jgi:predicted O-methyltransferase YrrM
MNNDRKSAIDAATAQVPGWSPSDQLFALFLLASSLPDKDGDILELGAWCGKSTIPLAMAARQLGSCKVLSVDLFPEKEDWYQNTDGTYSFKVEIDGEAYASYQTQTVWQEPFDRDIRPVYSKWRSTLEAFKENLAGAGLSDFVVPYRMDLNRFVEERQDDTRLRLAFIDGDHSYESVCTDIDLVERMLLPGGWICFDDAFTSYQGVDAAITERILHNPQYEGFMQPTRKLFVARKK